MKRGFGIILFLLGLVACQSDESLPYGGNLSVVLTDGETPLTRTLPDLTNESAGLFTIQLFQAEKGDLVYEKQLSEFEATQPHLFKAGSYKAVAYYGENPLLALDAPYYASQEVPFTVAAGQTTTLTIPCKVANALASFQWVNEDKLKKVLKNYYIEIVSGHQSVVWYPGDVAHPYFRAGAAVEFFLKGIWIENGRPYQKSIAKISGDRPAQAGKNYVYKLKIATDQMDGVIFDLHVQPTVEDITLKETLPETLLPKPKVRGVGFDAAQTLNCVETNGPSEAKVTYEAARPIEDLELTLQFEDEQFVSLNKTYLLSTLTATERRALEQANIQLPALHTQAGVIDLTALTGQLWAKDTGEVMNQITVKVKANGRWSEPSTYTLKTMKPDFAVKVYPGDIWTKEFTAQALSADQVQSGSWEKLTTDLQYLYSADGKLWQPLPKHLQQTRLTPGTTYYVKGVYRRALSSRVDTLRTYEDRQVPNASLDDGYETTYPKSKNPLYTFKGGWIGTRNPLTCHTKGVNAFYVSKSGTLPVVENGSTVAHLMTLGWGNRNTCDFGIKTGSVIHHISAGMLCVGDYDASQDSVHAKAAYIRPTKMSFVYKAAPYNQDEYVVYVSLEHIDASGKVTTIGRASLQSAVPQPTYTQAILPIEYDAVQKSLPISHVRIWFKSGTKEDRDHLENNFRDASVWNGFSYAYIIGSQFWLDSFQLHYER